MQVSEVVTDDATCISGSYSTTFAMTTGFQLYSSPVVWEWPGSDGVVIAPGDEQTVVFHGLHHQRRFAYQVRQCNSNKTGSRHFSRGSQPRATPHTPVCRALLSACAYRMLIGACNPML